MIVLKELFEGGFRVVSARRVTVESLSIETKENHRSRLKSKRAILFAMIRIEGVHGTDSFYEKLVG
jgi:hypothetical protein